MAGFFGVLIVALPGIESWILKSAGKTEGDWPGERSVFDDGGEIISGLFGGLAAREENDACEFGRNMIFESFGGL